ncbi:MAG: methyltransferase [Clostridiaceae bacterium]|nr:methyltransferase [Clostridiaceae bacterium]
MAQSHYFKSDQTLDHEIKTIEYMIAQHHFELITDRGVFSRNKVDYGTNVMLKIVLKELKEYYSNSSGYSLNNKQAKSQINMPESMNGVETIKCLDLGCGYGVVSIVLNTFFPEQKWYAVDINPRAAELTKRNSKKHSLDITVLESDGIPKSMDLSFDLVLLNPPIRTGKDVYYRLFAEVAATMEEHGVFYTVIQKKQGAVSAFKYLQELFSDVVVIDKSGGYHTIRCRNSCQN